MDQLVKHLLCKQEGLSSDPQHHVKHWAWLCGIVAPVQRQADPGNSLAILPHWKLLVQQVTPSQGRVIEWDTWCSLLAWTGAWTHVHVCMHTHIYTTYAYTEIKIVKVDHNWERHLMVISDLYMHIHIHACANSGTNTYTCSHKKKVCECNKLGARYIQRWRLLTCTGCCSKSCAPGGRTQPPLCCKQPSPFLCAKMKVL